MSNDTTVPFLNPAFHDEMTDLIRAHAQTAIHQAILAELEAFLDRHDDTDAQGRRNVVRNGYQPEREVLTGVGPVTVQLPKTRSEQHGQANNTERTTRTCTVKERNGNNTTCTVKRKESSGFLLDASDP